MTTTVPTPVDDLALVVWSELERAGEVGLSAWEIHRQRPELSRYQVKRGIDRVNQVLQETLERPLVHFYERGRSVVYRLPEHCPDYQTFAMRRLRELITRAHTELTRAQAATLRWPESIAVYLPKMLKRTIEDIEDIIVELGRPDEG